MSEQDSKEILDARNGCKIIALSLQVRFASLERKWPYLVHFLQERARSTRILQEYCKISIVLHCFYVQESCAVLQVSFTWVV